MVNESEATPQWRTLDAGDYLVEVDLARPAATSFCEEALRQMGWGDVIVDESPRKSESTLHRFVGRLDGPLEVIDSEAIRWRYVRRLTIDPFEDVRQEVYPFKLLAGETTEARFLHRLSQREVDRTSRDVVDGMLRTMAGEKGFHVHKLTAIRQHMRLPDRPNASHTLWLAVLRWDGPDSVLTIQDPLFFDDMVPTAAEPE